MAGRWRGLRQFCFGHRFDGDFCNTFTSIMSRKGGKNNTRKFVWIGFLLDHSHGLGRMARVYEQAGATDGPAGATASNSRVTYAEIARHFFVCYWPPACKMRLHRTPVGQPSKVMHAIEEFDARGYLRSILQIIHKNRARADRCVKEIPKVAFRQVVRRSQKVGGEEDHMFCQYAAGPPDREANRRIDREEETLNLFRTECESGRWDSYVQKQHRARRCLS